MKKRVFLIVLDSFGVGAAPDAASFGDAGANTLKSAKNSGMLNIPTLISMGLGNIDGVDSVEKTESPIAKHGRCRELSLGKDTTTGHWEIAGIVSHSPMPTYPGGFPKELLDEFTEKTGYGVLCNLPYSGTDVIRDYGEEHLRTGDLIVYTSQDSVFQIAAHEELVPPEKLYEYCRIAREILVGKHAVGRVIARPFVGTPGAFTRTANRRDFSVLPPRATALDAIKASGLEVIAVGKINDIFASQGVSESIITHGNGEGLEVTLDLLGRDFEGLCFINLVDFDMSYGHRQDVDGYARALSEFDKKLGEILPRLKDGDVLMITADHGCDPGDDSTDHTREYTPLIIYSKGIEPENLGTRQGFTEIGITAAALLGVDYKGDGGECLVKEIGGAV